MYFEWKNWVSKVYRNWEAKAGADPGFVGIQVYMQFWGPLYEKKYKIR